MTPYTRAEIENDLTAALRDGDVAAASRAGHELDQLPPRKRPTTLQVALWYAGLSLPVFPLKRGAKEPLGGSHGVHDATTDPVEVRALFRNPHLNVGLATGHGVDVLDFDGPPSHTAWTSYWGPDRAKRWEDVGVVVLATVSTPRPGGLHVYVPSGSFGNRAKVIPSIDYRGLGGYVVAPPSELDERPGQVAGTYRFLRSFMPGGPA